jgi:hemin uptake protein HemP
MSLAAMKSCFDPGTNSLPTHIARELTEGGNLAQIRLDDQVYTLRITRAGKLILTK